MRFEKMERLMADPVSPYRLRRGAGEYHSGGFLSCGNAGTMTTWGSDSDEHASSASLSDIESR